MLIVAVLPAHLMRSVAGGFAPWTVAEIPGKVLNRIDGWGKPAIELIPGRHTM